MLRVPFESVSGDQWWVVLFMGPLWFIRAGSKLGVICLGVVGWMDSILTCAVYCMLLVKYAGCALELGVERVVCFRRFFCQ